MSHPTNQLIEMKHTPKLVTAQLIILPEVTSASKECEDFKTGKERMRTRMSKRAEIGAIVGYLI